MADLFFVLPVQFCLIFCAFTSFRFIPARPQTGAAPVRRVFADPGLQQVFTSRSGEELNVSNHPAEHLFQFLAVSEAQGGSDNANRELDNNDEDQSLVSLEGDDSSRRSRKKKDKKHKKRKSSKKRDSKAKSSRKSEGTIEGPDDSRPESSSSRDPSDMDESEEVEMDEVSKSSGADPDEAPARSSEESEAPAVFPIVILIEPIMPLSASSPSVIPGFTVSAATRRVQGLATYATLVKAGDGYEVRPLRQKLFFDGVPCTRPCRPKPLSSSDWFLCLAF